MHERKRDSDEQSAVHKLDERTDRPEGCSEVDDNLIPDRAEATRDVEEVIRFA